MLLPVAVQVLTMLQSNEPQRRHVIGNCWSVLYIFLHTQSSKSFLKTKLIYLMAVQSHKIDDVT